jgi:hypothetical protein
MTDPSAGDPTEEQTIPVSRTRPARRTQPVVDDQTDGSTVIARRETRRRAARDHPEHGRAPVAASDRVPPAVPIATSGRIAAAPDAAAGAVYPARPPQPVIAPRSAPPERIPQAPVDGAANASAQRRRARRTAVLVLISACALVLAAAASLLVIALTP